MRKAFWSAAASEARRRFRIAYAPRFTLKRRRRYALPAHSKSLCNEPGSWPRCASGLGGSEDFELVGVLQHDARAVAAGEIDAPARANRRGIETGGAFEALLAEESLAGLRFEAREYGVV